MISLKYRKKRDFNKKKKKIIQKRDNSIKYGRIEMIA